MEEMPEGWNKLNRLEDSNLWEALNLMREMAEALEKAHQAYVFNENKRPCEDPHFYQLIKKFKEWK